MNQPYNNPPQQISDLTGAKHTTLKQRSLSAHVSKISDQKSVVLILYKQKRSGIIMLYFPRGAGGEKEFNNRKWCCCGKEEIPERRWAVCSTNMKLNRVVKCRSDVHLRQWPESDSDCTRLPLLISSQHKPALSPLNLYMKVGLYTTFFAIHGMSHLNVTRFSKQMY